jgi:hypothetical protein
MTLAGGVAVQGIIFFGIAFILAIIIDTRGGGLDGLRLTQAALVFVALGIACLNTGLWLWVALG